MVINSGTVVQLRHTSTFYIQLVLSGMYMYAYFYQHIFVCKERVTKYLDCTCKTK